MNLTDPQELLYRGWRKWSDHTDDEGRILLLCPLSDYDNVPNGTLMESISGCTRIKGRDYIDDDTRGGIMAFGVRA